MNFQKLIFGCPCAMFLWQKLFAGRLVKHLFSLVLVIISLPFSVINGVFVTKWATNIISCIMINWFFLMWLQQWTGLDSVRFKLVEWHLLFKFSLVQKIRSFCSWHRCRVSLTAQSFCIVVRFSFDILWWSKSFCKLDSFFGFVLKFNCLTCNHWFLSSFIV